MAKYKHLSLDERIEIQQGLNQRQSFYQIAHALGRSRSTVAREVMARSSYKKTGGFGAAFNDCLHRFSCTLHSLCKDPSCRKKTCRFCSRCWKVCPQYEKQWCSSLSQAPYVCNTCSSRTRCTLEKAFYSAKKAQQEYDRLLRSSREGVNLTREEAQHIEDIVSPLVKKGQSFYAIYQQNKDRLPVDQRTLYRYVENHVLSIKAIDLPRKVRYKKRQAKKELKVDKACRTGRSWAEFGAYLKEHPDVAIVQMDSVEGKQTESPVLMTLIFPRASLLLMFLRERNTAASVTHVFKRLYQRLGEESFERLFPLLLTDNGSEFSDPLSVENSPTGKKRTRVFYCDPYASYQKAEVENVHTLIRRILPKGSSFLSLTPEKVHRMESHINSSIRASLNHKTPYEMFTLLYGEHTAKKLDLDLIPSDEVNLTPSLLA